jgi:hypothetical protein
LVRTVGGAAAACGADRVVGAVSEALPVSAKAQLRNAKQKIAHRRRLSASRIMQTYGLGKPGS